MSDTIDIERVETIMQQSGLAENKTGVEGLAERAAEPLIELIMRQTNYDKDVAEQKLKDHNNDYMQVIREYMAPVNKKPVCTTRLSVNQQIYKEIRGMMDDAAKKYEAEKKVTV
jgi:hypothetical protein